MNTIVLTSNTGIKTLSFADFLSAPINLLVSQFPNDIMDFLVAVYQNKQIASEVMNIALLEYGSVTNLSSLIRETVVNEDYTLSIFDKDYIVFSLADLETDSDKYEVLRFLITKDLPKETAKYIDLKKFFEEKWISEMKEGVAGSATNSACKLRYAVKEDTKTFYCIEVKL